jgi:hypothetical protein
MTSLRTHFAYRIDRWDISGETLIEHVAGMNATRMAICPLTENPKRAHREAAPDGG